MLHVLFTSDFFKSQDSWYARVKSPAEIVTGVLRLTDEFHRPKRQIVERLHQMTWMGQTLTNPPSVEGSHEGLEWIDTGTFVERLNFASSQLGNTEHPGVRSIIERVATNGGSAISPSELVDRCLDEIGMVTVSDETRSTVVGYVTGPEVERETSERVAQLLQMIAATHEFQRA